MAGIVVKSYKGMNDKERIIIAIENLKQINELSPSEINDFMNGVYIGNKLFYCCQNVKDNVDCDILTYLIDSLVERAAKLVIVNIASIIMKLGKGNNPSKPVCIVAEGSIYNKFKLFKTKIDLYNEQLLSILFPLSEHFICIVNIGLL
jgi:hexokinase